MDRVAVTAILIVLLGIWVSPFIAGTNRPASARDAGVARFDEDPGNSHAAATALTAKHLAPEKQLTTPIKPPSHQTL